LAECDYRSTSLLFRLIGRSASSFSGGLRKKTESRKSFTSRGACFTASRNKLRFFHEPFPTGFVNLCVLSGGGKLFFQVGYFTVGGHALFCKTGFGFQSTGECWTLPPMVFFVIPLISENVAAVCLVMVIFSASRKAAPASFQRIG
jgi:hypothetical protein